jgi:hypothetical protein
MLGTVLTILGWTYIAGAAFIALMFLAIHLRIRKGHPGLDAYYMKLAPEYVLLWPWRCCLFVIIVGLRGGFRDTWPECRS